MEEARVGKQIEMLLLELLSDFFWTSLSIYKVLDIGHRKEEIPSVIPSKKV